MNVNIVEQDESKIIIEWVNITCPYCNNEDIYTHTHFNDVELSSKKLYKFFKKRVILKKQRYKCKHCGATFTCKTVFTDGIFTQELKPILKVLFQENLINEKTLNKEIFEKLELNNDGEWVILNDTKVLTLINKNTC